jgi:hypothetical protein
LQHDTAAGPNRTEILLRQAIQGSGVAVVGQSDAFGQQELDEVLRTEQD